MEKAKMLYAALYPDNSEDMVYESLDFKGRHFLQMLEL